MKSSVPGPTYREMLNPELLPPGVRAQAAAGSAHELDPINLFNITWRGSDNRIRHVVLPPELTGALLMPKSRCPNRLALSNGAGG